jgi:hypothetical protein
MVEKKGMKANPGFSKVLNMENGWAIECKRVVIRRQHVCPITPFLFKKSK